MHTDGGIFNITGGAAMVVDDGHTGHRLQQAGGLYQFGTGGVHHHQQRSGIGQQDGILLGDEAFTVLGLGCQMIDERAGRGHIPVDDKVRGLAQFAHHGADTGGGAHAVQIGEAVTHHEDVGAIVDQVLQGVGHHTGLDLGAFFQFLGASAVELELLGRLDDHLIAAAAEGHFDAQHGKLVELRKGAFALADADGQGGGDAFFVLNMMDALQNGELICRKAQQVFVAEDKQVAVLFQTADDAVGILCPFVDGFVDLGVQVGTLGLAHALGQFFITVHHHDGNNRLLALVAVTQGAVVGDIHPEQGAEQAAGAGVLGTDHIAVHVILALVDLYLEGADALAFDDPLGIQSGHHIVDVCLKQAFGGAGDGHKALVAPQHFAAVHPQDTGGQGDIDHSALGGLVHLEGKVLYIAAQLLIPALGAVPVKDKEQHHGHQFDQGQKIVAPHHGGGHKKQQQQHCRTGIGFGYFGKSFIHNASLTSKWAQ